MPRYACPGPQGSGRGPPDVPIPGRAFSRARLNKFLRLVKSGETVLVTERGRPVAMLAPVAENHPLGEDPRLQTLVE